MFNAVFIVLSVLFLGAVAAVVISCRGSSTDQSLAAETGPPEILADYLDRLQTSADPHAFLIVTDPDTGDFVQFTASPEAVHIDFPVITPRQQELEPRVRQVLESNGLRPETTTAHAFWTPTRPLRRRRRPRSYEGSSETPSVDCPRRSTTSPMTSNRTVHGVELR